MLPPDAQTQARSDRLGPRLRRSRARRRVRDARERPPESASRTRAAPTDRRARSSGSWQCRRGTPPRWETRFVSYVSSFVVRRRGKSGSSRRQRALISVGTPRRGSRLPPTSWTNSPGASACAWTPRAVRANSKGAGGWTGEQPDAVPFVVGLGAPRSRARHRPARAHDEADRPGVGPDDRAIRIEDKTAFFAERHGGDDGVETEKASKTGRSVLPIGRDGARSNTSVVKSICQRGEGWETRQERRAVGENRMRERNVLVRPGEEDVIVDRFFDRVEERKP